MVQIRQGIFETNSSSTHTLTMCVSSDFEKWKNGELIYDYYQDELVPFTDKIREEKENGDCDYVTYEDFNDWSYNELESFENRFTTPGGEEVVAFGYYGYNG